jgi:hypothetical protein
VAAHSRGLPARPIGSPYIPARMADINYGAMHRLVSIPSDSPNAVVCHAHLLGVDHTNDPPLNITIVDAKKAFSFANVRLTLSSKGETRL